MSQPDRSFDPLELDRDVAEDVAEDMAANAPVRLYTPDSGALAKRRVVLTTEAEMEALAPPTWLVNDILPEQGLASIFGAPETFKSFIALDLVMSVALGLDWHGHEVEPGRVVYVAAEGFFGMQKRYRAWKQYAGVTGDVGIYFLRHSIEVRNGSRDLRELREEIEEKIEGSAAAIVLDTLSRNLTGSENLPDDMGAYIRGCEELKEATGGVILSVHHTGHTEADRSRGHSSWYGALDVEMKCARDGDRVTVECTKMKDAPHFLPLSFDLIPIGDSLVPKACGTVDVKMTPARATVCQALPLEGGVTRSALYAAVKPVPPGTARHCLDWLIKMGYGKQERTGKFLRTVSGDHSLKDGVP
jgi:AAA domain